MVGLAVVNPAMIARGRAAAEALMTDEVEIRGPDTVGPIDPDTGKKTRVPGALRYAGKCKVQSFEGYAAAANSGGHMYTTQQHRIDIPVGAGPVFSEDIATITASALNAQLVGARSTINGQLNKSAATAQRLQCTRVAS